jgi:hypothetical protein
VKRAAVVLALAALCAGVGATLAATARDRGSVDPETDARPDGCGRDYLAQSQRLIPTWVYVGDRNAPAAEPAPPLRRLDGVVSSPFERELAVHPTPEDLPTIHRSYDLNFNVLPDAPHRALLGGSATARTGNYAGRGESTARVHVEREQGAAPLFVWPEAGDRISLVGSWIWDCGHWTGGGERTEIHPFDVLWVDRREHWPQAEGDLFVSTDKTFAGVQADCAHEVKGVVAAFQACLLTHSSWQDVSGTYRFRLRVPPRPSPRSILRIRVADAGSTPGAPPVIARSSRGGVDVTVDVHASPGEKLVVAKRVLASWTGAEPAAHVRVRFVRLLVRRAMDPGCPNGRPTCGSKETTHGEQVSSGPGEWNVYVDVAGAWRMWGNGLLRARDGQVFRNGPTLDLHLARGRPWRVFVFTRECDFGSLGNADGAVHAMSPCPRSSEFGTFDGDDVPGIAVARFRSPAAALGLHVLRPQRHGSTCPAVNRLGCYELAFRVQPARGV